MNKILLIEDDSSLGPAIKSTLTQEGYQVDLSENLEKARVSLKEEYDLVLLDWMLPDGQGVDLLKEINLWNIYELKKNISQLGLL